MTEYQNVIENQVFNSTLRLYGSAWDNTLIRNVVIEDVDGDGAILRDVKNVTFENVTIKNVTGDGIKLSMMGSTSNVVIQNSTISMTGEDGINAGQRFDNGVDHPGLKIIGNTIDKTGLNGNQDGLIHGIYVQSSDFLIQGNRITNSEDGNGISVRSWGIVQDNHIENSSGSGIAYYADHMGRGGSLVIEGNTVLTSGYANGRSDIDLLRVPDSNNLVEGITVRDNVLERGSDGVSISSGYGNVSIKVGVNVAPPADGNAGSGTIGDARGDLIRGNAEDNSMFGGAGADIFVFEKNGSTNTIHDFVPGVDRILIYGFDDLKSTNDLRTVAREVDDDTVITTGTGDRLVIANSGIKDFSASDFIFFDNIPEANGAIRVIGDAENNVIRGNAEDNIMVGGAGADIFVFEKNGSTNTIEDFVPGVDRILIYGFDDLKSANDLRTIAREVGGDTVIIAGTEDRLVIKNSGIKDFSVSDFIFSESAPDTAPAHGVSRVAGDAGANLIRGNADHNSMFGGAGADIFVFEKNGSTNTIEDFVPGVDRILLYGFDELKSTKDLVASAREYNGDTVISAGTGGTLVIVNTAIAEFSDTDFIFL